MSARYEALSLIKGAAAALTGKGRGPDHDPEGVRRTPRRDSYDADDDPRARPWSKIGDGSVAQGLAYREALIQAAKEYQAKLWRDFPLREIRDKRARAAELAAELDRYAAGEQAAVGRIAAARKELAPLNVYLDEAGGRLRRIDVAVLEALLATLDFATGRLFPAIETIAVRAACHRNSVIAALRRLRDHGFIAWVRRTVKTGNAGEFAPQREQTSNAYYFEHRRRMASRVFQRYWQLLVSKLRRIGTIPPVLKRAASREPQDPELRRLLTELEASLPPAPSAST